MSKRSALLAALVMVLGLLVTQPSGPAQAATVRIMPLGDSITGSPGCWRALLWNKLQSTGYTAVDFVGTLGPQGCSVPYDGDNEGHGWLSAARPDVVLMHFGTNDVWSNRPTETILAAYGKLIDQMRASNPNMKILVAKIIPMNPSTRAECGQRAVALNNDIPGWASSKTTTASPIYVVDQWTGFSTATDTYDGVHPNASGDQKMSDRWYPTLVSALSGGQPSPSPSPRPTPTPSPSPSPRPAGCTATYTVTNQWPGGFQGDVTVKNTGGTPITGWAVTWAFANGQQVTQTWNGTLTQSGANVTVRNVGWNGGLAAGATTSFGFLASYNGANTAPAVTCAAAA